MLDVADYPTKADVSERRAQSLARRVRLALKFKKAKDKIDELEVELYNKKCQQHKFSLEIFQNRKVDFWCRGQKYGINESKIDFLCHLNCGFNFVSLHALDGWSFFGGTLGKGS
jgi:hypothetical protein